MVVEAQECADKMEEWRKKNLAWQPIETAPEGKVVETKIDDARGVRNQTTLIRDGRLWFFPDGSMYVYYTPTHWREHEELSR